MRHIPLLSALLIGLALTPCALAQTDLVIVDQAEMNRYWRPATGSQSALNLITGEDRMYGCMAVPFSIEPEGAVGPGMRPSLVLMYSSKELNTEDNRALYELVIGAMPSFEATWGVGPKEGIYSTYSIGFVDEGLSEQLGTTQTQQLREALDRACRIDNLARWHDEHQANTVRRALPADATQWLTQQRQSGQ